MNELFCRATGLPQDLLSYNGSARLAEGLITLIAPDSVIDLLRDGYAEATAIPFAVTAFGDILVWEKDKYVSCVSFSRHSVTVISSEFDFFFEDITDEKFLEEYFDLRLYKAAKAKLGNCHEGECYISSPFPAIVGGLEIENLSIGGFREYNALSIDMLGTL